MWQARGLARRMLGLLLWALLPAAAATASPPLEVQVVARGLNHPWSLAFLPDGGVLVTERPGRLRLLKDGEVRTIAGVPPVLAEGQGGLFDVLLHPRFLENRLVYLSYAAGDRRANGTRVAVARLEGDRLANLRIIWSAVPAKSGSVHFGGRMAWLPDGTLLVTTGDGFDRREDAQRLSSPLGKIVRISDNGGAPADNPFAGEARALPAIWSLGHRNPQGLAYDPVRSAVFSHEHGPRGGDEVNRIEAGANFGWPIATHGRDYSGATISPFTTYPGMVDPLHVWTPSIAPSGLAVYRGAMFPEWAGDLLVGGLVSRDIRKLRLDGTGRVVGEESLLGDRRQRIRDVRVAPDGAIWVTVDASRGEVLRISRRAASPPGE
jgi:glucose/arabinose dehydrogenase